MGRFDQGALIVPPGTNELEVALIGPGFGECALVHIGDGKWIVVDSCIDPESGQSAPLKYLQELGVKLASDILCIVISHFDDDHISGMPELLAEAKDASVVMPSVYVEHDFLRFVARIRLANTPTDPGGVGNVSRTLDLLMAGRDVIMATKNRTIYSAGDVPLSHGRDFSMRVLSPCDAEIQAFHNWLAVHMPGPPDTRGALPKRTRNDISVVVDLSVGGDRVLLGADLEEHGNPTTGWSAVLGQPGRLAGRSQVYKVAHHGSPTGHHPDIWSELLDQQPIAILAPWINGGKLIPTLPDRARILGFTEAAFTTSTARTLRPKRRAPVVEKLVKRTTKDLVVAKPEPGMVRLRRPLDSQAQVWGIESFGTAQRLEDWN